jgi:WD40 repeat protein
LPFSPDSKFLASAGEDRTIYFWDMEDGHLVKKISGLSGEITATDTAPKDNYLVFGDKEGYCKMISLHPEGTLRTVQSGDQLGFTEETGLAGFGKKCKLSAKRPGFN